MTMIDLVDVYPYRLKNNEISFLIFKRSRQKVYGGQWRMIGGKVNEGGTSWQAGLSELEEETSVQPVRYWTLPSLNHFYETENDAIRLIPAFAARVPEDSEIIMNSEHTAYRWIAFDQIDDYIVWPEQRRLMKLAHRILETGQIIDEWVIEIA